MGGREEVEGDVGGEDGLREWRLEEVWEAVLEDAEGCSNWWSVQSVLEG